MTATCRLDFSRSDLATLDDFFGVESVTDPYLSTPPFTSLSTSRPILRHGGLTGFGSEWLEGGPTGTYFSPSGGAVAARVRMNVESNSHLAGDTTAASFRVARIASTGKFTVRLNNAILETSPAPVGAFAEFAARWGDGKLRLYSGGTWSEAEGLGGSFHGNLRLLRGNSIAAATFTDWITWPAARSPADADIERCVMALGLS